MRGVCWLRKWVSLDWVTNEALDTNTRAHEHMRTCAPGVVTSMRYIQFRGCVLGFSVWLGGVWRVSDRKKAIHGTWLGLARLRFTNDRANYSALEFDRRNRRKQRVRKGKSVERNENKQKNRTENKERH